MVGPLQLCHLLGELPRLRLPRLQLGAQFGFGVGAGKVLGGAEEEGGALVVVGEASQLRLQLEYLSGEKFDGTFCRVFCTDFSYEGLDKTNFRPSQCSAKSFKTIKYRYGAA